jgi:hypothetical protein
VSLKLVSFFPGLLPESFTFISTHLHTQHFSLSQTIHIDCLHASKPALSDWRPFYLPYVGGAQNGFLRHILLLDHQHSHHLPSPSSRCRACILGCRCRCSWCSLSTGLSTSIASTALDQLTVRSRIPQSSCRASHCMVRAASGCQISCLVCWWICH